MKKILLLALLSLVIYSCKDEERPVQQEEEIIQIVQKLLKFECLTNCTETLTIKQNEISFKIENDEKDEYGNNIKEVTFDTTMTINLSEWEKILSYISINEFMELDSFYGQDENTFGTEAYYDIEVKTNKREKVIRFLKSRKIKEIDSIHSYLVKIHQDVLK